MKCYLCDCISFKERAERFRDNNQKKVIECLKSGLTVKWVKQV